MSGYCGLSQMQAHNACAHGGSLRLPTPEASWSIWDELGKRHSQNGNGVHESIQVYLEEFAGEAQSAESMIARLSFVSS